MSAHKGEKGRGWGGGEGRGGKGGEKCTREVQHTGRLNPLVTWKRTRATVLVVQGGISVMTQSDLRIEAVVLLEVCQILYIQF